MATQTLDLNRASDEEIAEAGVAQIARDDAQALVRYREENGSFETWDDLKEVPGFSDEMVENLRQAGMVLGREGASEEWDEPAGE